MNDSHESDRSTQLGCVDQAILQLDRALHTLVPGSVTAARPSPASRQAMPELSDRDRTHTAGLMRVNHTGEVCAQALYQGQAATARLEQVRQSMEHAAEEEVDHLAWCEERLEELNSHPSYGNPGWYAMSFGLGALAGLAGDRWSLGFVAETEDQVCSHLERHLERLPAEDERSRAILQQMLDDERRHGDSARDAGGSELPAPVRTGMRLMSGVMKAVAYRI